MNLFLSKRRMTRPLAGIALGMLAVPAFAHVSLSHLMQATGFGAGLLHPFSGIDHLLAMIAVGIWAAQNKRSARWVLPLAFPLMMAAGALVAVCGISLPGMDIGIAGSVCILGLLIAFAVKVPVWFGTTLVSIFALAHGYMHGVELPYHASALQYGAGFIVATAILHLFGLAIGLLSDGMRAGKALRIAGVGIAAAGAGLLSGLI